MENRKFQRHSVKKNVMVTTPGAQYPRAGQLKNIGADGVLVHFNNDWVTNEWTINDIVQLDIDGMAPFTAKPVRSDNPDMAFKFLYMSDDDYNRIDLQLKEETNMHTEALELDNTMSEGIGEVSITGATEPNAVDVVLKSSAEAIRVLGELRAVREGNVTKLLDSLKLIELYSNTKDQKIVALEESLASLDAAKDRRISMLEDSLKESNADLGRVTGTLLALVEEVKGMANTSGQVSQAIDLADSIVSTHEEDV